MSSPSTTPRARSISKKSPRIRQSSSAQRLAPRTNASANPLKEKPAVHLAKSADPKPVKNNAGRSAATAAASPQVVINKDITESKLKLLQQSPLRRLIPEADRKAAAAQLQAKRRQKSKSPQKPAHPESSNEAAQSKPPKAHMAKTRAQQPVSEHEHSDPENVHNEGASLTKTEARQNLDDLKLGVAKKKEARKMRWKARQLRKDGKLVKPDKDVDPGVLYLGHIPHGFYEKEMRSYFSQFGEVLRVRLSRSVKTGRSRGYAFIEFAHKDVAQIAADAMDGYLMHRQKLVARFVPPEKVHEKTFKGANRTFRQIPWARIERRNMLNRASDPLKLAARSKRILKSAKRKRASLVRQGLTHTFLELPSRS